jgi:hypothetical protein
MTTKKFHISDILSVTTGRFLSTRGMDGLYDIMAFVTGDENISTIGLMQCADYAKSVLLQQFPHFDINVPETVNSRETADQWLDVISERCGAWHVVTFPGSDCAPETGLKADLDTVQWQSPQAKVIVVGSGE